MKNSLLSIPLDFSQNIKRQCKKFKLQKNKISAILDALGDLLI
jgi:hypothetical protein